MAGIENNISKIKILLEEESPNKTRLGLSATSIKLSEYLSFVLKFEIFEMNNFEKLSYDNLLK